MAASAKVTMKFTVDETLTGGVAGIDSPNVTHNKFKVDNVTLDGSSTPIITTVVSFTQALTASAATIDLTSLTEAGGASVDLTGLKIQGLFIEPTDTNTATAKFTTGATNGYDLGGSATFEIVIGKGATGLSVGYAQTWNDDSQDVAATDKDIDIAGTGTESFDIIILAG